MKVIAIGVDELIFDFPSLLQSVEKGLDIAASEIETKFLEPTQTWSHDPTFYIDKSSLQRTIQTYDPVYVWLNDGTKAHEINARPGGVLKIQPKSPKTIPYNFSSSGGGPAGDVYYSKKVRVKGIAPRGWDELIEAIYSSEKSGGGRLAEIIQNEIMKAE